jgi:hypothetical protein
VANEVARSAKRFVLVATAHYLVRVIWAMLKRGSIREEKLAVAKEPSAAQPE